MDQDVAEVLKNLGDSLGQAQAFNRANSYILMEIVRDLGRTKSDPSAYLADMFERISARADQGPIDGESHPVRAEFRLAIERFFHLAGKGLQAE